ncbi:MAG: GAF domain-containing protein [Deltaproteobacteria bacterium]|nr:GAF domain-containing protein [Deltaproteobacteria bacterium]
MKLTRLTSLYESAAILNTSLKLEDVLDKTISIAQQILNLDNCAILLFDNNEKVLKISRAVGYDENIINSFKVKPGVGISGWVFEHKEGVVISNVQKDPRYIKGVSGACSEMAVPLIVEDSVIGVLDAESKKENAFSDEDFMIFKIFASNVAVAIRNADIHNKLVISNNELKKRLNEIQTITSIANSVSTILNLDVLLLKILNLIKETLNFSNCAILLLDRGTGVLRVRAQIGYKEETVKNLVIRPGEGITGRVLLYGKPILIGDIRNEPGYIEGVNGGRSEISVPLVVRDEIIGVLDAESPIPNKFSENDLNLFSVFAGYISSAIYNAELFTELEHKNQMLKKSLSEIEKMNQELIRYSNEVQKINEKLNKRINEITAVYEASKTIISSLDLQETLQSIVMLTNDLVKSSVSAIKLIDSETQEVKERIRLVSVDDEVTVSRNGKTFEVPLRIGDKIIGYFELGNVDPSQMGEEEKQILLTLASQAAIAIENARLFEETQRTYYETIKGLAQALEARDSYTRGHSERVTKYALLIAEELGLNEDQKKLISYAGLLHDIGKIGIADNILNKKATLSPDDRKVIENHPLFGDQILGPIKFLKEAQRIVLHHHERYDGSGYPSKLKGEEIPLLARIITVADSFDAMTSDRPYRKAFSLDEALNELKTKAGSQFDPKIVEVFEKIIAKFGIIK